MNFRLITNTTKMVALLAILSLASCKKDLTSNSGDTAAANLSDSSTTADNAYYDVLNNAFVGFADNSTIWNSNTLHSGKTTTMSHRRPWEHHTLVVRFIPLMTQFRVNTPRR